MSIITRGFGGRRNRDDSKLPPGQYLVHDFPVLSAGLAPHVTTDEWAFSITDEHGERTTWTWQQMLDLGPEERTHDIHCVTKWSKLGTTWRGVPLDAFMAGIGTSADHVMAHSYGGYTTNLPLADLLDGKAWIAYEFDGAPLHAEHGGPARLLVPHLYFWKSAKWIHGLTLMNGDAPGFWEANGYHLYGDPWREQRYWGD